MPSNYAKSLAKELGKPLKDIEAKWDKAKKLASDELGKPEKDFGNDEYAYTTGILKKMLGIKKETINISRFINSMESCKDYIEGDRDMSPYIKKLMTITNKPLEKLKQEWTEAKKITSEFFGKPEEEFKSTEYDYAFETVKRKYGIMEEILDVSKFINSDKSAKEYIESLTEVQTSGDFDIGNVKPPKEDKKKDDRDKKSAKYAQKDKADNSQKKEKPKFTQEDIDEEYSYEDEELANGVPEV